MKIIQALEDSNILPKGVTKTIKNEKKEKKGGFLSMLLGTLGPSLLGNLLAGKGIVRADSGNSGIFNTTSSFNKLGKYKNIIKINQDLMVFFQEIICKIK